MGISPLQRVDDPEKIFFIKVNKRSAIHVFPNLRTELVRNSTSPRNSRLYTGPYRNMLLGSITGFVEMFHVHKVTGTVVPGVD